MTAVAKLSQQGACQQQPGVRSMTARNSAHYPRTMKRYALATAVLACLGATTAQADTLSLSVEVKGTPSAVWSKIGPFCAIEDWLPPVGTCAEGRQQPATRKLVTKDGKATFVEVQTMRNDAEHTYSYAFQTSPLPVSGYTSTLKVTPLKQGNSLVTWTGSYVPTPGKEKDAIDALSGIYAAGMASIKSKFGS
jgi:hypothetical protein